LPQELAERSVPSANAVFCAVFEQRALAALARLPNITSLSSQVVNGWLEKSDDDNREAA